VAAPFTSVCLFSGGLDSFVGAIDLFARRQKPLLVSHYGDNSTSSQELCAKRLASSYGDMTNRHVRANVRFDRNDFSHEMGAESTTRGRSFLFFALAALAASGFRDRPVIYVPENGLISLNVPLDPLRVGAWSTRTTHPFYMARWQELLDRLGVAATLENPYRFRTKGEMLRNCGDRPLAERYATDTISCSSVTKARWRGRPLGHCGFCVPCLIRRAALTAAFGVDKTTYTIENLQARTLDSKSAEGEHVRSFQMMARRLEKRRGLGRILVHKSGPLSDYPEGDIAHYADVFRRGIEEVDNVTGPAKVRPI
jgi:7-cyano-7-deazaguanine synthase in queuosine biosynthesis